MAKMFKPETPSMAAPPPLAPPTPEEAPVFKRMPVMSDPSIMAAGQRTREAAMKRKGRLSTILTDNLRDIGSSGIKLGA